MKTLGTLILILTLSLNSISQTVKYSIEAGGNYQFFTMTSNEAEIDEISVDGFSVSIQTQCMH